MGNRIWKPGGDVIVEHEPNGLRGHPCVSVNFVAFGVTIRITLEDAESLGEKLIECVRGAEEVTPPSEPPRVGG